MVHLYDLHVCLPYYGGHDSTAKQANLCFFSYFNYFLYLSLNLKRKWMPHIHCGKQPKLSKAIGVPLDTMGEMISSRCPKAKVGVPSFCLINCFFPPCLLDKLLFPCSTCLLLLQISSGVGWQCMDLQLSHSTSYLLSPCLCFFIESKCDLFVYCDDSLTS